MKKLIAQIVMTISVIAIFINSCLKPEFQLFPPVFVIVSLSIFALCVKFIVEKSAIGKPLYIQDWITNDIEIGTKFSLKFIGYPSNRDLNYKLFLAQTKNSLGEIDESLIVLVGHSFSDGNYRKTKTKNAWGSDVEFLSK